MDDQAHEVSFRISRRPKVIDLDCSGYICIGMTGEKLAELDIPMMVPENQERHRTAYTVTVDYKEGRVFSVAYFANLLLTSEGTVQELALVSRRMIGR